MFCHSVTAGPSYIRLILNILLINRGSSPHLKVNKVCFFCQYFLVEKCWRASRQKTLNHICLWFYFPGNLLLWIHQKCYYGSLNCQQNWCHWKRASSVNDICVQRRTFRCEPKSRPSFATRKQQTSSSKVTWCQVCWQDRQEWNINDF